MFSKRFSCLLFTATVVIGMTGCPDYSHLRDVPNYADQRDPNQGDTTPADKAAPKKPADDGEPVGDDGRTIE